MGSAVSWLGESFEERVRRSGTLVAAGMVVTVPTLFWNHALSFILFGALGLGLTAAGVLLFLHAAVTRRS